MAESAGEERILIFAPTGRDADLTCKVLEAGGLECFACRTADHLLAEMENGVAGLLLVEETLKSDLVEPLSRYISMQPHWSDLPILLLASAGASSPALNGPIQTLGNVTLLERPVRTLALISAAGSALRARKRQYGMREAEQRKDEFLASLGHELRNPLAPIRTAANLLNRLYPNTSAVNKICDVVTRQVTHLTRLVDDLLDVARITRGKVMLQRAPTSLAAVIDQAVEMCAALADVAHHRIEVSQPANDVPLIADHARLVQSVANVLANAIKFTPPSGNILLKVEVRDDSVTISVKDSGIGLDRPSLTKIFDLFVQSEAGTGHIKEGLGIGLSLAKQFVEMHGGSIRAESDGLGCGSEFIITVPREAMARISSERIPQPPRAIAVDPVRMRVLVVDDNQDAADMLKILFRSHGFVVASAYGGEAALQEVARFHPDVVVMDLGMPGLNGYEVARRFRDQPRGRDLILIALTGWGQEKTRKKALEVGFGLPRREARRYRCPYWLYRPIRRSRRIFRIAVLP